MSVYRLVALVFLTGMFALAGRAPITSGEQQVPVGKATFAGGCFWCMEPPFDKLDGVISTTSGYIGGHDDAPTYSKVSAGRRQAMPKPWKCSMTPVGSPTPSSLRSSGATSTHWRATVSSATPAPNIAARFSITTQNKSSSPERRNVNWRAQDGSWIRS